jgi:glycerophosphoryl diester phosphodiesterase
MPALRRVGHKGADLLAPGNTRESFDAARAAGVDMIEFDVLPEPESGRLVLAHDHAVLTRRPALTLEEGLAQLAGPDFKGIELDVDLKLAGYEQRVLDALAEHGLIERTLISCQIPSSLALLRRVAPEVRLGWSVPRVARDYLRSPLTRPAARAGLALGRQVLPGRAAAAVRAGRCDALMAHSALVTPRLARALRAVGGELYVWTVDDAAEIARFAALGATGVISNDPRLFGVAEAALSSASTARR